MRYTIFVSILMMIASSYLKIFFHNQYLYTEGFLWGSGFTFFCYELGYLLNIDKKKK